MSYQKFKGTGLFTGRELLPGNQVLITEPDGTIVAIVAETEAGDDVRVVNGLLCPGFVNAHCHLELSHLRGAIPEGTGLIPFLQAVPKLRQYPADEIQAAMAQAAESMHQNGIVAVGDICNTADSLTIKQQSPLQWHNFIETIGFSNEKAAERFAWSKAIYDQFEAFYPWKNTLVPHAPYSVSEKLFGLLNQASAGKISTIHSQESEAENEWYRTKTGPLEQLYQGMGIDTDFFRPSGKSSLQTFWPWMDRVKHLLLVHNVAMTSDDLRMMNSEVRVMNDGVRIANDEIQMMNDEIQMKNDKAVANPAYSSDSPFNIHHSIFTPPHSPFNIHHSTFNPPHSTFNLPSCLRQAGFQLSTFNYFILCPLANLYIQRILPPVNLLRQHGCTIALGTDSLASNHQLSIWAEIQTLQMAFPDIPLAEMLQWATLNGAMALGMEDRLGSFEKGKRPGVVCINNGANLLMG